MTVGIILLSQDNFYLDKAGKLPPRPKFDKSLLTALCRGQTFVCGPNTFKSLPPSIMDNAHYTEGRGGYDVNLGIKTLHTSPPHLLIVVRSGVYLHGGKHFSLEGYGLEFQSDFLELWILK